MARYAAAISQHPLATQAVGEVAGTVLEELDGVAPDLVVCFGSPHHAGPWDDIVGALHRLLRPGVLMGAAASAVAGESIEVEDGPALSVFAASLPGTTVTAVALDVAETPDGRAVVGWPDDADDAHTLVLLADPFTFPVDALLTRLREQHPDLGVVGGLASAGSRPGANRLALDERVRISGAVGALLTGGPPVVTVVSQGCRPVGRPFTVTAAQGRMVEALAGQPALERLQEVAAGASEDDRELMRAGLHLGVVVDDRALDYDRGDFLVRNVIGADRESGAVAVGGEVAVGTTVQFQVRDAASADEDLHALLAGHSGGGALLFTCNGRGERLFGAPHHDAGTIQALLGPLPLAGMACAGEIGPIAGASHLHGLTASVALFPS